MILILLASDSVGMIQILMINLPGCWVGIFETQKVPEMRNIGLASIEAMWPQLGQNSIVAHKTTLHAKFQVISLIGGCFTAPPCPRIWTLVPPFEVFFTDMGRLFLKKYHFLEEEYNLQPLKYHLLSVGENWGDLRWDHWKVWDLEKVVQRKPSSTSAKF